MIEQKQLEEERVSLAFTQDHSLSLREGTGTQAGTTKENRSLVPPKAGLAALLKTQDLTHEPRIKKRSLTHAHRPV